MTSNASGEGGLREVRQPNREMQHLGPRRIPPIRRDCRLRSKTYLSDSLYTGRSACFENFTGAIHATGAGATDHENPLRWRGVGVGCYGREGPIPEG